MTSEDRYRPDTELTHIGNKPEANHGIVNPPVYHASTVLFSTVAEMEAAGAAKFDSIRYGRIGTPTSWAFEEAVTRMEGGYRGVTAPSGLAAVSLALMAATKAGDHVLITDSVYDPTRQVANAVLARFGVEVEYYDPRIGGDISSLLRPNTSVVFVESPGSLTFEIQDVPAIAAAAKAHGATVIMDNTWATPLYFKPLEHGIDIVVHAATKYIVGHADAMLGICVCTRESFEPVKRMAVTLGHAAGPDDLYLGLRGLRTLSVRLERHQKNALEIADWLAGQPEVARVLHPARSDHPDHALFKRDFRGSSGLFGVVLKSASKSAVTAMLDGMRLFGMGFSWGGYESLAIPTYPEKLRTVTAWEAEGPSLRLHIGLEDTDDLKQDLRDGLDRLAAAR